MSNSRLETQNETSEIATDFSDESSNPQNALRIGGQEPMGQIILGYFFDDDQALLQKPFSFFGISSLPEQIKSFIYYAAPLDQVEALIRQYPKILLKTFEKNGSQGTLLQLAVIGLDQSIRKEDPSTHVLTEEVIDEGMAERLLSLHDEFERNGQLPAGSVEQAKQRASEASPIEDKKEKNAREQANKDAVKQLFDAFVQRPTDEKIISTATETFKEFTKSLKVRMTVDGRMTTNRYHLNLIHLISCAFDELRRRGGELPGGWYGALGDRFCIKIIGDAIETELKTAPRVQQILRSSLYHLLNSNQAAPRSFDVNATIFSSHKPSWLSTHLVLGVDSYYDDIGPAVAWRRGPGRAAGRVFQNLLQQLHQPLRFTLRPRQTRPTLKCIIL